MTEMADWTRAYVLMGKYGATFIPVLLGPLGEMYAVLQGDDDGVLRTVTLDSEGRLSAFVIDSTDAWGRMLSIGNAELAVRLGSAVAYDRRGQVMFFEDFERGWGLWTLGYQGAGYAGALDPTTSLSGGYSFKLTAGDASGAYANISMLRATVPVGKVGLEFVFAIDSIVNYVGGWLYYADGSRLYQSGVRYGLVTDDLELINSAGAWENIDDVADTTPSKSNYNTLKFVIDLDTKKYERVLFNEQEWDLSASSYCNDSASTAKRIEVWIWCYGRVANNDIAYIDDIIVTVAEPANT